MRLVPGRTRVQMIRELDRSPLLVVPAGSIGRVEEVSPNEVWVRLETHYPQLDDWSNCLIWRGTERHPDVLAQDFVILPDRKS